MTNTSDLMPNGCTVSGTQTRFYSLIPTAKIASNRLFRLYTAESRSRQTSQPPTMRDGRHCPAWADRGWHHCAPRDRHRHDALWGRQHRAVPTLIADDSLRATIMAPNLLRLARRLSNPAPPHTNNVQSRNRMPRRRPLGNFDVSKLLLRVPDLRMVFASK